MELDELKSAWNKFSSEHEKHQLSENELRRMLKKRTVDIADKIRRNIRIGIGIVLAWVSLGFATDFILSPIMESKLDKPYMTDELMLWSFILEVLNYVLIFSAIIIFWIRYNKIDKETISTINLRDKLKGIIGVLTSYKRMFYIIMGIIIVYVALSFSTGFIMEYRYQIQNATLDVENLKLTSWLIIGAAFVGCLSVFIVVYYLLFTFFFKRLYGRHLQQLQQTLLELNESASIN